MVPGQGLGADARAQNLACSWSGRGLAPPGSSRLPVPVCSCPLPSSCLGPLPTLPRLCRASCLAGPGALLAPRTCGLGPGSQPGACLDPALLGPASSGERRSPPSPAFQRLGVPWPRGCEARLGLAFPVASPAFLGRGRKGVGGGSPASFWGAWCGEGGRRALEGLLEEGAHAAGGCWLGECPLPPRGSPGPPTWPCPSLHTAPTGNSPPQEAGCACTVGTVSNSAECNLSPLPWGPVVTAVPWALSLPGHLISAPCLPFLVSRYLHLRVSLMA